MPDLKLIAESFNDQRNKTRIEEDFERFYIYSGQLLDIIRKAIRKEFKDRDTIEQLDKRIIPLNFLQKIINKSSVVYMANPDRKSKDKNLKDDKLIDLFSEPLMINQKFKWANRLFKLMKHTAIEPFVDRYGIPRMRALPAQSYTLYSDDEVQPEKMTAFIKHLKVDCARPEDMRLGVWTDDEYYIIDGRGNPQLNEMYSVTKTTDTKNPFGVIPFTYISDNDDGQLMPLSDDDLKSIQIAINIILTDQSFISKFATFSGLAVFGAEGDKEFVYSPNSIMFLPAEAKVEVIKPQADIDMMIKFVEKIVVWLMSTKNLKTSDIQEQSQDMAGIAKKIDEATTTMEERQDQVEFFTNGEKSFWDLFAHKMLPFWKKANMLDSKYNQTFSEQFELSIQFNQPAPMLSLKDRIEEQKGLLEMGMTTEFDAMKALRPHLDDEQIKIELALIKKEKQISMVDSLEMSLGEPDDTEA